MNHELLKPSYTKHRPGCLSGHERRHIAGNTCSSRWYAARRARADDRIQYTGHNAVATQQWKRTKERKEKLQEWLRWKKIHDLSVGPRQLSFKHDAFTTGWWPFTNQVHHIIPHSSLLRLLQEIARKANDREPQAFEVMIDGLLDEPYNLNDEPNVMVLPLLDADAVAMGLPRHLLGIGGTIARHSNYSDAVKRELDKRVGPRYRALITAIKTKKHPRPAKAPVLRPVLEALSAETYEEILSKTAVLRDAGTTEICLDSIAVLLYR